MNKDSLFKKIIYTKFVQVSLKNRTIRINNKEYMMNGRLDESKNTLINAEDLKEFYVDDCLKNPWDTISKLYQLYKHSIPSKQWNKYKAIFKALPYEELSDNDLIHGYDRFKIKNILEGYILIASYTGILKWEDESKWFWQDDEDKDLVILKKYIKLN